MKKLFIVMMVICVTFFGVNAFADSSASVSGVEAGANVDNSGVGSDNRIDNSVNTSNIYNRQFVNPGNVPMGHTNGFFTAPTPDSSFRGMADIMAIFGDGKSIQVNKGVLEDMAKGGKVMVHYQMFRDMKQVPRYYKSGQDYDKFLTITLIQPKGIRVTALVDAEATNGKSNTLQVLGKLGLAALKDGCNYLVLTAEGAHRKVEASGWGIGGHGTYAGVNEAGKLSGLGGGGLGYSSNQTGSEDRPWIQGYSGVVGVAPTSTPLPDAYSVGNYNHGGN